MSGRTLLEYEPVGEQNRACYSVASYPTVKIVEVTVCFQAYR